MGNILQQIVADKRVEVAAAESRTPLAQLQRQVRTVEPPRNFYAAVTRRTPTGVNLIAEIKRRSPSAGLICPDFDPAAIARIYHAAGAAAISVLTDGKYFDGRLEYVATVRAAVPLPVLRKDFVLGAYQLWEARVAGADAVLLIAEVLGPDLVVELATTCAELGLTALIEAHDGQLLQRVLAAFGPQLPRHVLIGVNNRDLTVQKTDLQTTLRLARLLADTSILVSESGIHTREDVLMVQQAGARAILVGESLLIAGDPAAAIRNLLGPGPS